MVQPTERDTYSAKIIFLFENEAFAKINSKKSAFILSEDALDWAQDTAEAYFNRTSYFSNMDSYQVIIKNEKTSLEFVQLFAFSC